MSGSALDNVTLHHVNDLATLDECRRWMGSQHHGIICADTESGGLNPHKDRHRLTQLGDMDHGWAFGPQWMGAAHELLARWPGRIGMFNAPYDWRVLEYQSGMRPRWEATDDAQPAGHLVNSREVQALKPRAAREVDNRAMAGERLLKDGMRAQGWNWATVPEDWDPYWMYGALDPVLTSHLLERFLPVVRGQFSASYDLDLAYARLCASMMSAGMAIDEPYIREHQGKIASWAEDAREWLAREHGIRSVNANQQIGEALRAAGVPILHRTKGGMPSCDKDTMAGYAAEYPHAAGLIRTILGARKAGKIVNDVFGKFLDLAVNGVVHCSIHPLGAQRTSRSSITDPALQTLDRDIEIIRGSFIPRPGYSFISIDADQIELRLAAHISGDAKLIAEITRCDEMGESFFLNFASTVFGPITKSDPRYTTTKNTVYSMIFGAGPVTAARTAGRPLSEVKPIYDSWRYTYTRLNKRSHDLVDQLEASRQQPYVNTLLGRKLYVDWGKEHAGVDYEIQGSAAEILKDGAVQCAAAGIGEFLRLPIHDELLFEAPTEHATEVLAIAERVLTNRTDYAVPLTWSGTVIDGRWKKT